MDVNQNFEVIRQHLWQFIGGTITMTKDDTTGVATLCLNRPEKRNALSGQMMVQFRDHIIELEQWNEGKAVIIYGEQNFCSGGDLDFARATGTPEQGAYMSIWMQDALTRLQKLSLVSVCLTAGPSLGGGAEISVFCDYIIAADDVRYGFVHGKMGIIPAFGGSTRLAWKIGSRKAMDLLLTAKILTADEMVEFGLAECVVPAAEALTKTREWLSERLQHHYSVVRALKDIINKTSVCSYRDSLEYERNRFCPFWGCEINKAALLKNIKHLRK